MRLAIASLLLGLWAGSAPALELGVTWLHRVVPPPPVLSNLDPVPEDLGRAGAELGLRDNRTTGQFLGHSYGLSESDVPEGGDILAVARDALAQSPFLIVDAPAADLLAIADLPEAQGALIFNAAAPETALRSGDCRANLLHTLPSRAMLADALMQGLASKRWTDLALITGPRDADHAWAEAMKASAAKFRLRARGEAVWDEAADMRRNASQEVPLFTQGFRDHDVLLIADEAHDFARYIAYNTWLPRPVAGSAGMMPAAWSRVVEQWGAAQLQSRFEELAGRPMQDRDYAAWAAFRALGEAVTRTGSADPAELRAYMLGDDFELAGFKGSPLSFRPWNGQLRQPIPLVTDQAVVAVAPMEGFLHQGNELDTLGLDRPDSACTQFD
ncbi:ABC transporter substrate-binding protein [Mangrovicoccus sp. HB161399]|uniref:ABC transporter substrate-binding protein n=1 Tax=Mangrovicoccus sp. HB161399 TaxID=2720392 RepID=UPI0015580442|nr:ABC transporter substrate-binding protein [Mangrovicoccus sp. HB161399]